MIIDLEELNLMSLLPVGILVLGSLILIVLDLLVKNLKKEFFIVISLIFFALSFYSVVNYTGGNRGFFDTILIDGVAKFSSMIILVISAVFLLFSFSKMSFHDTNAPEFYPMYLLMSAGFMQMCLSENLIVIFVGLETGSLALYALIALHNRLKSIEAALKYFAMGALASGLYAFGAFLFYAVSGSVEISVIVENIFSRNLEPAYVVVGGCIFLLASLGFKLSLVPFHTWTPDIYEGSSAQMAGYMSIVPKVASFIVIMRLFESLSNVGIVWIDNMLYMVAIVTMTLANIAALTQEDIKRMLGFSSISHAGFLLSAILIGSEQSNTAFFVYWIMFSVANLGAFLVLWISKTKQPLWKHDDGYVKFSGLIKTSPFLALSMGIFMVSLAGIPPFSLFWGKLFLMSSAISGGYITLAVIMAINSAIALWYYLKVIVFMFLKDVGTNNGLIYTKNSTFILNSLLIVILFTSLVSIFFNESLMEIIKQSLEQTRFFM